MNIVFSCLLMLPVLFDIWHVCTAACHDRIPSHLKPTSKWKLCVKRNHKINIQLKIIRLFQSSPNINTGWLAVGFPETDKKIVDFFLVTRSDKSNINVKQLSNQKHVNCKINKQKTPSIVTVNCKILDHKIKHLNSQNISVVYISGNGIQYLKNIKNLNVSKNWMSKYHGKKLSFNLYETTITTVKDDAGSTAMKLLLNYGKSMAAIIGIAIILTTVITITICCCCRKNDKTARTFKEKDVSVSFYRDNGEADGESDDSDNNDEKVAFIRNNNGKNSKV